MKTTFMFTNLKLPQSPILVDDVAIDPDFLITILAGVVLAMAFQFILTAISVAAGVSAIGDVKRSYVLSKVEPDDDKVRDEGHYDQDHSTGSSSGVKITTAFGIWSVVTTCLALFGATALALNLNVVESLWLNITTSLVVWGLFFLLLFYLEAKIARTLIGSLISAATSGLRSSVDMIGSMLTPSPESKVENMVGNTIEHIRKEMDAGLGTDELSQVLDNFLDGVDKKLPDYDTLKEDLEMMAKNSGTKNTSAKWMAAQQVLTKLISENSNSEDIQRKGKAKKLQETLEAIVTKYNEAPGKLEGIKNVIEEFTPMDRKAIEQRLEDAKEYLRSSSKEGLSIERIRAKFKEIMNDPKMVMSLISDDFKQLDRETVVGILSDNTKLERKDVEGYADSIDSVVRSVAEEFDKENDDRLVKRLEGRVRDFFDTTGRAELDFSVLKNDIVRMFDNPKDSFDIIKKRFETFDGDTLRAVITNNKYVSEEQIDSLLKTFENGKNDVLEKIAKIESTANQRIEMAKRKAVIQAEHARATAASAAWWLVLTTILSGVAAIAGGMLPL